MSKSILFALFILFFFSIGANSQSIGVLLDVESKTPISNAHIVGKEGDIVSVSDEYGIFKAPLFQKFTAKHLRFLDKSFVLQRKLDTVYLKEEEYLVNTQTVTGYTDDAILKICKKTLTQIEKDTTTYSFLANRQEIYSVPESYNTDVCVNKSSSTILGFVKPYKKLLNIKNIHYNSHINSLNWNSGNRNSNYLKFKSLLLELFNITYFDISNIKNLSTIDTTIYNINYVILKCYKDENRINIFFNIKEETISYIQLYKWKKDIQFGDYFIKDSINIELFFIKKSNKLYLSRYKKIQKLTATMTQIKNRYLYSTKTISDIHFNLIKDNKYHFEAAKKITGYDLGKKTVLITKKDKYNQILSKLYSNSLDNSIQSSAIPKAAKPYLLKAFEKAVSTMAYQTGITKVYPTGLIDSSYFVAVDKNLSTIFGFAYYLDKGKNRGEILFNGSEFYESEDAKGKIYRYQIEEFWELDASRWTHFAFMPYSYPELFLEELYKRAKLADTIGITTETVKHERVLNLTLPNSVDTLEVFIKLTDSTYFGYRRTLNGKTSTYIADGLRRTEKTGFHKYAKKILSRKEDIETVPVQGEMKKALRSNVFGKRPLIKSKKNKATLKSTKQIAVNVMDGTQVRLQGKYTLLAYWYSVCPYCYASMPQLQKFHSLLGLQDFQVLGVNPIDASPVKMHQVWVKEQNNYPNTYDYETILNGYEPKAYPTYILLGKDGQVLDMQEGYNPKALERMVRKHVK